MVSTSMSDFKIEKVLGKGSFGSVYLVTRKADQKIYAIKTVILEKLSKKEQENSVNEVRILASINHPNVIGYKEAFWNDKESSLNIVMEYADDGDLQTKIQKMRKEGGMFTENLIWSYSIQMIEGLKALHDKKIMHRDLKSANIFLVKDKHQCKLGDMNVSKVIKDKVLLTQTGTPYYASPEVWNDKPYSYKSDLWSIGCVIYELCSLRPPFHGKDLDELYANVCKGKVERINQIYSEDLWKMIKMLLQVDVNKRVDCDNFLKSKLILRKKKELKEKNQEFNYIENKLGENINNGILLSTIKFTNINEIKSQLPKNKNYNDENIDYINIENNINTNLNYAQNNKKGFKEDFFSNLNSNKNYNLINQINYNYKINCNNQLNKNISEILSNYTSKNINNNYYYRNSRILNSVKNSQAHSINRTNSMELNDYNHSYKDYRINGQNYFKHNFINDNEKNNNDSKPILIKQEIPISKISKIKSKKEMLLNKYSSLDYIKKKNNKNKERFKTELQKENYNKLKQYNKIKSIPMSIKRTSTSRQNISRLKNDKNKCIKSKDGKNYSCLQINDSKATNKCKFKYNIPLNSNSITEIRSKTPINLDKNKNKRANSDIFNDYTLNYKKLKKNGTIEHQKSVGYLRNNIKTSIIEEETKDIYNKYFNNSKIHKCSKSISDIYSNLNSNKMKEEILKNRIISNRKENIYTQKPISAILSKRLKDISNLNNNRSIIMSYNYNNFKKNNFEKKNLVHNSNSYYHLDLNNNSKSNNNRSTMNINYDYDKFLLKESFSPIKRKSLLNNKNKSKFSYEKISTSIESNNCKLNNKNNNHKKLLINNLESIKNKNVINYNNRNVKKINKMRNISYKRSYDNKSIREKMKRNIGTNRDLTEPELMMIMNPIKEKENIRNNNKKKSLNISLNDNIGQNNFLKHIIKHSKPITTNNIKINNQYYSNNINNNINNNRNLERNRGTQIFNNFYSINNIGTSKIPVRVINVFN